MKQAFIRFIPWIVVMIMGFITNYHLYTHPNFKDAVNIISIGQISQESTIYIYNQVVNLIFVGIMVKVGLSKTKRGFHDDMANTYCIESK